MKSKQKFVKKKEFLQEYEDSAKDYDFERLKDYEGITVLKTQLKILTKILKKNKAKNILEAGCGTGRILLPLTKRGFNIEGFDLSKNMIKELKKKNPMIKTKIGDIEKIPYKNNEFDFVYSVTVLMHLPKIEKAISEMYRITKKGGTIVFDLSNKDSLWTKISLLLDPNRKRTAFYSKKDIGILLKSYDYQISGIFSYARTFYKIPLLKYFFSFLDKYLPLPVVYRSQYYIIIKKKN